MLVPPKRRFTIADGMVLIAASAVAMLLARAYMESLVVVYKRASADRFLWAIQGTATCVVSVWMLALIPLRLRHPRPAYRRLVRQPGFAACCAIASLLGLGFLEGLSHVGFREIATSYGGRWPFQQLWEIGAAFRGPFVVLGAWLLLALSGRWRPEASWIDRLGRVLGAMWAALLPIHLAEPWLLPLLPAF